MEAMMSSLDEGATWHGLLDQAFASQTLTRVVYGRVGTSAGGRY